MEDPYQDNFRVSFPFDEDTRLDALTLLIAEDYEIPEILAADANKGDADALRWIKRLVRYGVTKSLIGEIDQKLRRIRTEAFRYYRASTGRFEWSYRTPNKNTYVDRDAMYADIVASIINTGQVSRLKRCALKECRKYFVGNAKAKWCSNNCGSKFRARQKRKRDKESQML